MKHESTAMLTTKLLPNDVPSGPKETSETKTSSKKRAKPHPRFD